MRSNTGVGPAHRDAVHAAAVKYRSNNSQIRAKQRPNTGQTQVSVTLVAMPSTLRGGTGGGWGGALNLIERIKSGGSGVTRWDQAARRAGSLPEILVKYWSNRQAGGWGDAAQRGGRKSDAASKAAGRAEESVGKCVCFACSLAGWPARVAGSVRGRQRSGHGAAPGAADACKACTEWAGGGGWAGDGCGREDGKL